MAFQPAKDVELATGYRLVERLGTGGYGDVWKATAPGGLTKAVKFVFGATDGPQAEQELKALNRIKEVRHPFLLSLERIDFVDGQLVIITELADGSLLDRYVQCVRAGLQGIPRDELLAHLRDAADALDYMARAHGLQHLDVKPQNLLLVGDRIKVADFGQVRRLGGAGTTAPGVTPVYATPEAFDGRVSRYSDQYSLAIVYQEMLTGLRPFPGSTMMQLAAQHIHSAPLLEPLPPSDRPAIARALAKVPEQRFPTCLKMVEALLTLSRPDELPPLLATPDVPGGDTRQLLTNEPTPQDSSASLTHGSGADALRETLVPEGGVPVADRPRSLDSLPSLDSLNESTDFVLDPAVDALRETAIPAQAASKRDRYQPLPGAEPGIRPTLFLGIGGLAGAALRRLKSRLAAKYGDPGKTPAFRILLVDTDREDLRRTQHDDPAATLAARETLHAPLHAPEHYRQSAKKLQRWLDRRWMYAIPRSLSTQGLRPLGRLALVDNSAEILEAIRAALAEITAPEAVAATARATGSAVREEAPRVFVLASMTGGTGSGMLVTVAFAVRQALGQMGLAADGLCGVLLHATSLKPEEREMARVNATATLCELELLGHRGAAYPGEPESGLMPFRIGPAAFEECYVVQLGDRLDRAAAETATEAVADYLYLDASPRGGACLDRLRARPDAPPRHPGDAYSLRTFGLATVDARGERSDDLAAQMLCRRLIEKWLAEPGADVLQDLQRQAQREASVRGLDERSLSLVLQSAVSTATGNRPDAFIPQVLARAAASAGSTQPARMLGHVDATFVATNERPGETSLSNPTLHAVVRKVAESHGAEIGQGLVRWLAGLIGQPGQRFKAAERTATFFTKTLDAYAKSASGRVASVRSQRLALRQKIEAKGSNPGGSAGRGGSRPAVAGPKVDRELDAYCRLRLREITEDLTVTLLGTVQRHVEAFLQHLADLCRQLRALSDRLIPAAAGGQSRVAPRLVLPSPGVPLSVSDDTLPSGMVQQFDRSFEGPWLERAAGFGGGLSLADHSFGKPSNATGLSPEQFAEELLARARSVLQGSVKAPDSARLFLRAQGGPERARAALLARVEAARPKLAAEKEWEHVVAALPEGPSGEALNEMAFAGLPGTKGSLVAWNEEVLFCFEAAGCRVADVMRSLIGPSDVPEDLVRSVMTRLDVAATHPAAGATFS
jgi:serine/threonine protein kinase